MIDPTEAARRSLIEDAPVLIHNEVAAGRPVWTTEELREQFTVESFLAPFVVVTRKADGARGTVMFTGAPRFYFSWVPD